MPPESNKTIHLTKKCDLDLLRSRKGHLKVIFGHISRLAPLLGLLNWSKLIFEDKFDKFRIFPFQKWYSF